MVTGAKTVLLAIVPSATEDWKCVSNYCWEE